MIRGKGSKERLRKDVNTGVQAYDKISKLKDLLDSQKAETEAVTRRTDELEREVRHLNHRHRYLRERQLNAKRNLYVGSGALGRGGYGQSGGGWIGSPHPDPYLYIFVKSAGGPIVMEKLEESKM